MFLGAMTFTSAMVKKNAIKEMNVVSNQCAGLDQ